MKNKCLFFAIIFISIVACKKDNDPIPSDFDRCDEFLGSFSLLPQSFDAVPYAKHSRVIFSDSLNHEIAFPIETETLIHSPFIFRQSDSLHTNTFYCFYGDHASFTMTNDSMGLTLSGAILTNYYITAPSEKLYSDLLSISMHFTGQFPFPITKGHFVKILDARDSPASLPIVHFDSIACFDKVFYQVENSFEFHGEPSTLFYTKNEGIVIFEDGYGKKWCFDRFE